MHAARSRAGFPRWPVYIDLASFSPTPPVTPAAAPAPAVQAGDRKTMLEIASSPPGAEIELDGGFSGSTPSSVGVTAGDHTVRLTKAGYKPWERKLRTSVGNIKIAAQLEAESAPK